MKKFSVVSVNRLSDVKSKCGLSPKAADAIKNVLQAALTISRPYDHGRFGSSCLLFTTSISEKNSTPLMQHTPEAAPDLDQACTEAVGQTVFELSRQNIILDVTLSHKKKTSHLVLVVPRGDCSAEHATASGGLGAEGAEGGGLMRYNTKCTFCGFESTTLRVCSGCSISKYCNAECQRADWQSHKTECMRLRPAAASQD